jgi:hypothetical protein
MDFQGQEWLMQGREAFGQADPLLAIKTIKKIKKY